MNDVVCPRCGSSELIFSKKRQKYICEECENIFSSSEKRKTRIFFSYGHDENEWLVKRLMNDLRERGYDIWIDTNEIKSGDNWRKEITEGILNSDGVVAFLSKHSVRNPGVCLDELLIAHTIQGGNIRSVLLEDEKIVSPPSLLTQNQWLDMSMWKLKYANEGSWNEWYEEKLSEIIRIFEEDDFKYFSEDMNRINSFLNVNDTSSKEQYLLNQPYYGREWATSILENWRENNFDSKAFIFYGAPGIGKSAFAVNQLYHNPYVLCGFLCEWDKKSKNDSKSIIKTLAYKICKKLPDYRKLLIKLFENQKNEYIEAFSETELFELLLSQPLLELIDGDRERQLIIIDGLDEATKDGKNVIAELLSECAIKLPRWIGLLLTSRPERNIGRLFSRYNSFEFTPNEENNTNDIQNYLIENLNTELSSFINAEHILNTIICHCEGNFLYAALFVEGVKAKTIDLAETALYPKGLNAIHLQNFQRAFSDINAYEKPRKILEVIISSEHIPAELIYEITEIDKYEFNNFKEKIGSLLVEQNVTVGQSGEWCTSFSFCHKSVLDWLTDEKKSGRYFVDADAGYKTVNAYFSTHIYKPFIREKEVKSKNDYLNRYIQLHIIENWEVLNDWASIFDFLIAYDTPLFPYWNCLNRFPDSFNLTPLLENLWYRKELNEYFNTMQRYGETNYISFVLSKLSDLKGITNFNSDLFETYVDTVHLSGNYKKAVSLYDDYLSNYDFSEICENKNLLHFSIRKLHHSMFFSPVRELIKEALELIKYVNPVEHIEDYYELLFLIGGNLGVLSGNFAFAASWLAKAEEFSETNNNMDFRERTARKQADILCLNGEFKSAVQLIEKYVDLNSSPQTRYEVYLYGALAETYRQIGELDEAQKGYERLYVMTKEKGLIGWQCHALLGLASITSSKKGTVLESLEILKQAKSIYLKNDHAWGLINSDIVEYLLLSQSEPLSNYVSRAKETLKKAKELQYNYEAAILEQIINNKLNYNYRLLFL